VAWFNKGDLLLNLGKYNESIEAYDRAIELNQSYAAAWSHKGNAFSNLSRYNESLECYNKAIELDPKYAVAWNNKGAALSYQANYDDAIKAYDEAIRLDPQYPNAWYNKGNTLARLGKYDEAAKARDEAHKIDSNYSTMSATEYRNAPDWMEVSTFEQGRGMGCYIILHNKAGNMIRSDGTLRIEVYENVYNYPSVWSSKLWSESYSVKAKDFVDTTAGLGSFAQPVTIWSIGRIPYDTIRPGLGDLTRKAVDLEVRAYFETNDGRTLKDKTSQYVS
jgi:tetratricopeptide (TPR) repeat protein